MYCPGQVAILAPNLWVLSCIGVVIHTLGNGALWLLLWSLGSWDHQGSAVVVYVKAGLGKGNTSDCMSDFWMAKVAHLFACVFAFEG